MSGGDGARGVGAIGARPALEQPRRRVDRGIERFERGAALARETAQYRVDEPGIAAALFGFHETHGKIDGGVIGHFEKKNLRGAHEQRGFDARRVLGQAASEKTIEQRADAAEPAQGGRHDHAHQRAVALGERVETRKGGMVESAVERPVAVQHFDQRLRREAAGGKARHVVLFSLSPLAGRGTG